MIISVYLIIALVCGLLLIIMAAMGGIGDTDVDFDAGLDVDLDIDADVDVGHGDFGGTGISPLSIPVLLIFGTMFGCTGAILEAIGEMGELWIPLVSLIVATIITAITFVIMVKIFVNSQGSTAVGLSDLVELEALVTIRITKEDPGQIVATTDQRGRVTASAVAYEDIATNSQVKITGVVGNSVRVEKLNKEE